MQDLNAEVVLDMATFSTVKVRKDGGLGEEMRGGESIYSERRHGEDGGRWPPCRWKGTA